MSNTITLAGEVNSEMFAHLMLELSTHIGEDIQVVINSSGGNPMDAIAIASQLQLWPKKVETLVLGQAFSAASLILCAGSYRKMSKYSWLMVHEGSIGELEESMSGAIADLNHHQAINKQWLEMLEEFTGIPAKTWADLEKANTYLTAQQCLDLGIIHEIV